MIAPVSTLVGTFGGFWFSSRNDEKRDERAARRDREARRDTRAERMNDERHEVQRQTLIDVQDRLNDLMSQYTVAIVELSLSNHRREHGEHDDAADRRLTEALTDWGVKHRAVHRLQSRVLDTPLRNAVETLKGQCNPYPVTMTGRHLKKSAPRFRLG